MNDITQSFCYWFRFGICEFYPKSFKNMKNQHYHLIDHLYNWKKIVIFLSQFIHSSTLPFYALICGAVIDSNPSIEARKKLYKIYRYLNLIHILCYRNFSPTLKEFVFEKEFIDDEKPDFVTTFQFLKIRLCMKLSKWYYFCREFIGWMYLCLW